MGEYQLGVVARLRRRARRDVGRGVGPPPDHRHDDVAQDSADGPHGVQLLHIADGLDVQARRVLDGEAVHLEDRGAGQVAPVPGDGVLDGPLVVGAEEERRADVEIPAAVQKYPSSARCVELVLPLQHGEVSAPVESRCDRL